VKTHVQIPTIVDDNLVLEKLMGPEEAAKPTGS